mgnify:CR=1 FL=1
MEEFFILPKSADNCNPSWFGFPIRVRETSPISRDEIVAHLTKRNIGIRLLFGGNLTKQPLYENVVYRISGSLENTDCVMNNVFWIGVQPNLTDEMKDFVIDCFEELFE